MEGKNMRPTGGQFSPSEHPIPDSSLIAPFPVRFSPLLAPTVASPFSGRSSQAKRPVSSTVPTTTSRSSHVLVTSTPLRSPSKRSRPGQEVRMGVGTNRCRKRLSSSSEQTPTGLFRFPPPRLYEEECDKAGEEAAQEHGNHIPFSSERTSAGLLRFAPRHPPAEGCDSTPLGRDASSSPKPAPTGFIHFAPDGQTGERCDSTPSSTDEVAEATPTKDQRAMLELVVGARRGHPGEKEKGRVVQVTAGAGCGKTTALLMLARRLLDSRCRVLYTSFNKSSVADVKKKAHELIGDRFEFQMATCHSIALRTLGSVGCGKLLGEEGMEELCRTECQREVDELVIEIQDAKERDSASNYAHKLIRETLQLFLQSDLPPDDAAGFAPHRTLYAAKLWHCGESKKKTPSGLPWLEHTWANFYVRCAKRVWDTHLAGLQHCTHDSYVKVAQLRKVAIHDVDVILIDESQDLSPAQAAWFFHQRTYGTDVFFVGDAAQAIYGFRGADPSTLLELDTRSGGSVIKCSLTQSFRFGRQIAAAANTVLFVKENCQQPRKRRWDPYRLSSGVAEDGQVVKESLIDRGAWRLPQIGRITVLARTNAGLVKRALEMIGALDMAPPSPFSSAPSAGCGGSPVSFETPRIAVCRGGDGSGLQKFQRVVLEVKAFHRVWKARPHRHPLTYGAWKAQDGVTWEELQQDVEHGYEGSYTMHIQLVEQFQDATPSLMERFKREVLQPQVAEDDADVLLATVHAAKGREWPVVELCDDFSPIHTFSVQNVDTKGLPARMGRFAVRDCSTDALNIWYVALTRAQRTLALPPRGNFVSLVDKLCALGDWWERQHDVDAEAGGDEEEAKVGSHPSTAKSAAGSAHESAGWGGHSYEDASLLYKHLYRPWAGEVRRTLMTEKAELLTMLNPEELVGFEDAH